MKISETKRYIFEEVNKIANFLVKLLAEREL